MGVAAGPAVWICRHLAAAARHRRAARIVKPGARRRPAALRKTRQSDEPGICAAARGHLLDARGAILRKQTRARPDESRVALAASGYYDDARSESADFLPFRRNVSKPGGTGGRRPAAPGGATYPTPHPNQDSLTHPPRPPPLPHPPTPQHLPQALPYI